MFENKYILFIVAVLLGVIIGFFIGKIQKFRDIKKQNAEAIKKSKSILLGQMTEQIIPILPNFSYNPKDMTFIGKGVDYIIFDGLSAGNLQKIIFLEVKTGKSQLNKNEKMIRNIISEKKVFYDIYKN